MPHQQTTESTPENLIDDIKRWGSLEWHSGFLSRRAYDQPTNYTVGAAKMDAETESQAVRYLWAPALIELCHTDPDVTDEQRDALVSVINNWAGGHWTMGWVAAEQHAQHGEDSIDEHPLTEYQDTEIYGTLQVWEGAIRALVDARATSNT